MIEETPESLKLTFLKLTFFFATLRLVGRVTTLCFPLASSSPSLPTASLAFRSRTSSATLPLFSFSDVICVALFPSLRGAGSAQTRERANVDNNRFYGLLTRSKGGLNVR